MKPVYPVIFLICFKSSPRSRILPFNKQMSYSVAILKPESNKKERSFMHTTSQVMTNDVN